MISTFYLPVKIILGPGSVRQLGEEARALGHRAMIVTYPDIRRLGILDRVIADLAENGVAAEVFEGLETNPRGSTVDRAAAVARERKVDLVIGLGGGSAMDAAKGVALASSGEASIWDYLAFETPASGPVPAVIQVPTIAGTGSELNDIAVFTDWNAHEKLCIFNSATWAKVAIVDPALTVTVPLKLTAAGGVDTFAHIAEWYLMPEKPLPMNDAIREAVMRVTVQTLPHVLDHPDDVEARSQLSWASTIASSELAQLGGTVGTMTCHGIEHAISGYYDINHGAGLAALLPTWMRQILPVRKERLDLLGRNVFGKADGIAAFEEWLEKVGMRIRLRDLGCELERADEIAEIALKLWDYRPHPTPMDAGVIAQIYRDAY
ncbi:MAG: iron-containing alcohol dehydrogenase [Armatimonadetes bacterium]|nr:iron-containing alcohol dehydrogenase [Armatimonadota bacterium]